MTLKDKVYEIIENAYKFNRNPEETCEKIMKAINNSKVAKEYTDEEKENVGHETAGLLSLSIHGTAEGKPVYFCLGEVRNAIDVFDIVRGLGCAIENGYTVNRLFALKFDVKKD